MGKTVLTFGEIMMRLSPKDHLRIEQATPSLMSATAAPKPTPRFPWPTRATRPLTSPLSRPTVWASALCAR